MPVGTKASKTYFKSYGTFFFSQVITVVGNGKNLSRMQLLIAVAIRMNVQANFALAWHRGLAGQFDDADHLDFGCEDVISLCTTLSCYGPVRHVEVQFDKGSLEGSLVSVWLNEVTVDVISRQRDKVVGGFQSFQFIARLVIIHRPVVDHEGCNISVIFAQKGFGKSLVGGLSGIE